MILHRYKNFLSTVHRFVIPCILIIPFTSPTSFVFDLGETLMTVNQMNFAFEAASLREWISYALKADSIRSIKTDLPHKLYAALEYAGKQTATSPELLACDFHDNPLPLIMCAWMQGRISEQECLIIVEAIIAQLDAENFFANESERTVICGLMRTMFDTKKLIESSKPIRQMISLIKELSKETDDQGNPKHIFYVLSNIDKNSFAHICKSKQYRKLFKYIPQENWIASAEVGLIKPDPAIFTYLLDTFALDPEDTLFVDDRIENIRSAKNLNINCWHFNKDEMKNLRKFLVKRGDLSR
jgi:phosphoglycolate phosphatase-like HAD superfamily hydrolase